MNVFGDIYRDRRVLLTGHTGFKGSWLALWLKNLGARVTGLALPPESTPSHWDLLNLDIDEKHIDIRDADAVADVVNAFSPEIVFHLAAQSLVRRSYRDPLKTWGTNVLGSANVLEACRQKQGVDAIIVVTTDKCYENQERESGYSENDRLGGHDPYSASKAGTELVVSSYRDAFFNQKDAPLLASARAGNVIGGGDWSEDRLIPDLVRAIKDSKTLEIRYPHATRPWQHVLECLSGYLGLGQKLMEGKQEFAQAWNFGPDTDGNHTVKEVLSGVKERWSVFDWQVVEHQQPHEAQLLQLDSTKARQHIGWRPVWSFDECLSATVEWYRAEMEQASIVSLDQLKNYISAAKKDGLSWSNP